jgi:hypothetical protein
MARWERDRELGTTIELITQRIAEGTTLKEICRSLGWPRSFVWKWINADPERKCAYDDAMKAWADELAQETIQIADNPDPKTVGRDKLRVDTRLKIAAKWDRQRYGEQSQSLTVNAGGGSLVQILASLPPLQPTEALEDKTEINVTPEREQPTRVVPMDVRAEEAKGTPKDAEI